jgi:glycosyltransferase involved in cell wall biosynthesis
LVRCVASRPLISIVCCAHNEEEYVDRCISSLLSALRGYSHEIIFVADRCSDQTVERAEKYNVTIVEKNWKRWKNSYAEALETGYHDTKGTYIGLIDVDMMVPANFFEDILPKFKGSVASVAAHVIIYPSTLMNSLIHAWERTYNIAPLGREPYGAARIIVKKALDDIEGFRDVPTPDTDIDMRLAKEGYRSVSTSTVKGYHMRRITFRTIVRGQINSGRGRYVLGISLTRTIGHAIFRLRPFVVCGWFLESHQRCMHACRGAVEERKS